MNRYEVAFSGQLVPGAQRETVEANLARLFQADARRIAALFSGHRMVIKQNLDQDAAERYRTALERAGAQVEIAVMPVEIEEIDLAPPPPATEAATPARRLQVKPRDEYMAAFVDVDAPDFGLAPEGADLQDRHPDAPPPPIDLSALSLAPAGTDLDELPRAAAVPVPDISHLRLQD